MKSVLVEFDDFYKCPFIGHEYHICGYQNTPEDFECPCATSQLGYDLKKCVINQNTENTDIIHYLERIGYEVIKKDD